MSELDALFGHIFNAVGHTNRRDAQLGRASDGAIVAGDGYVWVRPQNGGETRAKNVVSVSTKVPNAWVVVGENTRTGELEVIGASALNLFTMGQGLTGRVNTPDVPPELFAGTIPADAIQDLRVRAPDAGVGGLNVCIEAGRSDYGYHYKEHQSISAYRPATASTRWWVVSYLDTDGVVYFSTAGSTESMLSGDLLRTMPDGIPYAAVPVGAYPLYAFILENGQTEVTATNTVFQDIRLHFAQRGLNTDSIMTNASYEVMVDADGFVMVES